MASTEAPPLQPAHAQCSNRHTTPPAPSFSPSHLLPPPRPHTSHVCTHPPYPPAEVHVPYRVRQGRVLTRRRPLRVLPPRQGAAHDTCRAAAQGGGQVGVYGTRAGAGAAKATAAITTPHHGVDLILEDLVREKGQREEAFKKVKSSPRLGVQEAPSTLVLPSTGVAQAPSSCPRAPYPRTPRLPPPTHSPYPSATPGPAAA